MVRRDPGGRRLVLWGLVGAVIALAMGATVQQWMPKTTPALTAVSPSQPSGQLGKPGRLQVAKAVQGLPLLFEPNVGQADDSVRFIARGSGYAMLLRERDIVLNMSRAHTDPATGGVTSTAPARLTLSFEGAHPSQITGADELSSHSSYFIGSDPAKWQRQVRHFGEVRYDSLYDGIDCVFHGNQGLLKFDLLVAPGADPSQVKIAVGGAERLSIDANGDLLADVPGGQVRKPAPVIYQDIRGRRVPVKGGYRLDGNSFGFELGRYDRRQPLVIDPTLSVASYVGGNTSDLLTDVALDAEGNVYAVGYSDSANLVPIGGPSGVTGTGFEVLVVKLNSSLTTASYLALIGGSGIDRGAFASVDSSGAVYFAGSTTSTDFPLVNAAQATPVAASGDNFYFAKIGAAGDTLVLSSYWNATTTASTTLSGLGVDATGAVYLAGSTAEPTFPQVNSIQSHAGSQDVWVTKFSPAGNTVVYSTLLGGNLVDQAEAMAVDSAGNVHLTGSTSSTNFPLQSPFQSQLAGSNDAFVTVLSGTPGLSMSTYLGGGGAEDSGALGYGQIVLDASANVYVVGYTASTDFPLRGTPMSSTPSTSYVARFGPLGATFPYSSYLPGIGLSGGTPSTAIDLASSLYIASASGVAGNYEVSITQLTNQATRQGFQFTFGGTRTDTAQSLAVGNGTYVVVGDTQSADFPQTAGSFQATSRGGTTEGFIAVVTDPFPLPDLLVRHSGTATFTGDGVYNTTAANQTATGNTVTSTAAVFPFQIQNDGNVSDSITLTGTGGGSGWTVRYFDALSGGNDVTTAMTTSGVPVANLAVGGSATFRVELTPDTTVAVANSFSANITAVSGVDGTRQDVVRATATRILGPRLEFAGTTGYVSDGVQPDSGGILTSFDFQAMYRNSTGTAAAGLQLILQKDGAPVNGSPFSLAALSGSDPVAGVLYHVTVTGLTKGGQYTYQMTGSDGTFPCTGPLTASLQGPVVGNTPPTVSNVAITPATPLADQDLQVTYSFADSDGDADQSSTVAWTINGNPVGGLADQKLLPASRTAMGDQIVAVVTPGDGTDLGAPLASATVTVQTRTVGLVPLGFVGVQGRSVPISATLRDGANNPIAGELVTFANNGGSIAGGFLTVATDANGQAVSQAILGLGPNQISATSGGASAAVTVTGRPPGTTVVTLLTPQVTADQAATIDVRVADTQSGQAVAGMGVTSAVASGTVTPLNASAVTDATGVAHFTHTFGLGTAQLTFTAGDASINGTIVALAGAIARSRSTVVLSKDTVPSDGVTSINIVATLKDVNGNPVAGVPGSSFRIASNPDLGLAVSFGNSDAQGVATGRLTATRAGTTAITLQVVDPRNNQLTTLTDTLALKVLGVFALRLEPGLNLIGSPVLLENTNPTVAFATVTPLRMARYLADTATYRALNPVQPTEPFNLDPGRAFWLRSSVSRTVLLAGDPGATGDWSTKLSGFEWTLASIPTLNAIAWDPDRIRVSLNDVELGSLTASPELVAPYAWVWNAGRQQNELVISAALGISGSADAIPAGSGFWIKRGTRTDLTGQVGVVFNVQQLARSRAAADQPAGPGNWSLGINAAADGLEGSQVTVGVSTRLSRALEIERPPVPTEGALNLELVDQATGRAFGGVFDSLPVTGTRTWRLRLSGETDGPVTLSWPSANRSLPRGYRLILTDPTSGQQLSLLGNAAMQVELGADGAAELELTMSRQTGDRLAIGVVGHPTRSRAASLAVTLNQPAEVTLRVVGLGGRVVRQWSAGRLDAGTTPVSWDGLDANGRRVPAGTYRLEAWASDDLGEAATATTVVTVQ